ncbi:hypothetical protein SAMN02927921_00499 [Sinomicrobium oceani]|uniref:Uncharacterized protein n=1 Tax=Sinomicrobium oceani TaxID=1150368 RepID=A0A1K1M9I1_9FLAO|nr:hypothetical protein SAMN02927921_00499 [Sinomicrobium oceani]
MIKSKFGSLSYTGIFKKKLQTFIYFTTYEGKRNMRIDMLENLIHSRFESNQVNSPKKIEPVINLLVFTVLKEK